MYYGAIQAAITEVFPFNVRSTCLSLSVNVSVLLFGSFAQFFVTLFIKLFANPLAVTIYPLAGIAISLFSALLYQEHHKRDVIVYNPQWESQI